MPFDYEGWRDYEKGWKITDIFPHHATGIKTHRDHFVLDFDENDLLRRIKDFCDPGNSDEEIRHRYGLRDNREWQLRHSREALGKVANRIEFIQPCLYRPFDSRFLFYHDKLIDWPRFSVMRHMPTDSDLGTRPRTGVGLGSGHLHPSDSDPPFAICQGSELPLPALPLRPGTNLGLTVGRAGQVIDAGEWNIVLYTNTLTDVNLFRRGGQVLFPLYLYA